MELINSKTELIFKQFRYSESKKNALLASLQTMITENPKLSGCDPASLINAAIKIESLNLKLGTDRAYIIPYKSKKEGMKAQLQIGYKGYYELAMRSSVYSYINVTDIREGEVGKRNRLKGSIELNFIEDDHEREKKKIVGYAAYYQTKDGVEKTLYMSNEELDTHLTEYSQSYKSFKKGSTFGNVFATNKNAMFAKTVLKLLLTRHGILSSELNIARTFDSSIIENQKPVYIDNPKSKDSQEDIKEIEVKEEKILNAAQLKRIKQFYDMGDEFKKIIKVYCQSIGNKDIKKFKEDDAIFLISKLENENERIQLEKESNKEEFGEFVDANY